MSTDFAIFLPYQSRCLKIVSVLSNNSKKCNSTSHVPNRSIFERCIIPLSVKQLKSKYGRSFPFLTYSVAEGGGGGSDGGSGNGAGGGGDEGNGKEGGEEDGSPSQSLSLWATYLLLLERNPVSTKSITSMLINMLGDLFCQLGVEKRDIPDFKRLGISALLGLLLVGPTLHFWYSALGSIVTIGGSSGAALQLFLDQFVFSPSFICVFFATLLTLEGRPQEIVPKLKQDWATTVVTNWKIWIPFQFLNFRLVPPNLQVAVANIIALAWNVYLSFASHTEVDTQKAAA